MLLVSILSFISGVIFSLRQEGGGANGANDSTGLVVNLNIEYAGRDNNIIDAEYYIYEYNRKQIGVNPKALVGVNKYRQIEELNDAKIRR